MLPVITGEGTEIVVLYADIREFSKWSLATVPARVAGLVEILYNRVIQLAQDYRHTFHKFLGDGYLLIWEKADHGTVADVLPWALGAAFEIHKKYWYAALELGYPSPKGLGIGIACGGAVKVQPGVLIKELNELDFIGYPMNCGARLQSLAGPYGVVLDAAGVRAALDNKERSLSKGIPALELELLDPLPTALEKASKLNGLTEGDRVGFKYVVWPHVQEALWKTDGRI
ncbi:MAG: adenylate/guanylate cyclase domain-containing protein [Candidatus Omnitrophica bacterium]|nr:adenylate/guanylate cyclase domain-containing protein [Candidatus Omnitrophota bacterium]